MKKRLVIFTLAICVLVLCSCGTEVSKEGPSDENKALSKAFEILSRVNSFEYVVHTQEETQFGNKIVVSNSKTDRKEIKEPLVIWGKYINEVIRTGGEHSRIISETYQRADHKKFEFYMRFGSTENNAEQEPQLSDWQETIDTNKEQIEMTLEFAKGRREAELYLLSSNMESFRFVEETETVASNTLRYDGSIDPSTAIEAYKTYLRDYYVQFNMVRELKDPSLDDLKKEITSGDVAELQSGIPQYAYAEESVPISIWISKDTFELKKVVIDKTAMVMVTVL